MGYESIRLFRDINNNNQKKVTLGIPISVARPSGEPLSAIKAPSPVGTISDSSCAAEYRQTNHHMHLQQSSSY